MEVDTVLEKKKSFDTRIVLDITEPEDESLGAALKSQFQQEIQDIQMVQSERLQNIQLCEYQLFFLKWFSGRDFGMLADDMGLGKTIQAIALIAQMVDINKKVRILIVVQASLLNFQFVFFLIA